MVKKQQDVANPLIELVKDAPKPAPGRIDTYAYLVHKARSDAGRGVEPRVG